MVAMKKSLVCTVMFIVFSMLTLGCSSNSSPKGDGGKSVSVDDMSEKVSIVLLEQGWINTPTPKDDPLKQYLDQKFNIDFTLQNVSDFGNKALSAFAGGDPPDIILTDKDNLLKYYKQGVLIDDWTPYLEKLPSFTARFNELSLASATLDGKIIGLPKAPRANNWGFMIRMDWLDNVGLSIPTNEEELLEVLRAFTFKDPDKNNKNDTWGISSAGDDGLGEITVLQGMYGPIGFYVTENGKINSSILDGNHKRYLDFMRTVVSEKLIDPDWYTQGWEQRKAKLFGNKYGIAYYPPMDLFSEHHQYTENKVNGPDIWGIMNFPKASPNGGFRPPADIHSGILTVSAKAANDPTKLERIIKLINDTTYPNDGYFALRNGIGVPGIDNVKTEIADGTQHVSLGQPGYVDRLLKEQGLLDYGI